MSRKASMMMAAGVLALGVGLAWAKRPDGRRVEVTFVGGHETDRRDGGRPVALVAGALGVKPEIFREAFSRVNPARGSEPSPERVHQNKDALLRALSPYGITNERLDEVSDHYRYRPERGEMWPTTPAKAFAILDKGEIVRFEIVDGGSGYSSPPTIVVPGMKGVRTSVKLAFGKRFEANGSIRSMALAE